MAVDIFVMQEWFWKSLDAFPDISTVHVYSLILSVQTLDPFVQMDEIHEVHVYITLHIE